MVRINLYTIKQIKESGALYGLQNKKVTTPRDIYTIVETVLQLQQEASEKFGILTLNTKNEVIGVHIISIGSLNQAVVHPREIFKAALLNNANSLVCFHNHPSGDPAASPEDVALTQRLVDAGTIIGIHVLDHIIIGDDDRYISLKERGLM